VVPYEGDLLIHVDTSSLIERAVFFYGSYEPHIISLLKRLLRPGFVVCDVGANVGCHTLMMAALVRDSGRVLAVEPHPDVYAKLVRNIRLNRLANVDAFRCALSSACGMSTLYAFREDEMNEGISSLSPASGRPPGVPITVNVRTLDELMGTLNHGRLDVVKVDVEGHECDVLTGATQSITRFRPHLVFEYVESIWQRCGRSFGDVRRLLTDLDYQLYSVEGRTLRPVRETPPTWTNILAVPAGVDGSGLVSNS